MRTRFQRSKQPAGRGTAEVCCRPADPMAIGRARLRSAAPARNRSQFSVAGWLLGARGKGLGRLVKNAGYAAGRRSSLEPSRTPGYSARLCPFGPGQTSFLVDNMGVSGETPLSSLTAARAVVFFLRASSRLGRRDGCGPHQHLRTWHGSTTHRADRCFRTPRTEWRTAYGRSDPTAQRSTPRRLVHKSLRERCRAFPRRSGTRTSPHFDHRAGLPGDFRHRICHCGERT